MSESRFDRNELLFGASGQAQLRRAVVAVVGVGGLGTHVVQQLALLGAGVLLLVDPEDLSGSNRNRYIGARHDDPVPGTPKVEIGRRIVAAIDPEIRVVGIPKPFRSKAAFEALAQATHVFGCLDTDGERLILNEVCSAFSRPYIDLATDVIPGPPLEYGGRVCINWSGDGCVVCLGILDQKAVAEDLGGEEQKRLHKALYGVSRSALGTSGPSVVSLNGVVASLGVTEFMAGVTGLRVPHRLLKYYGAAGKVVLSKDPPDPDCWYCKRVRGSGASSDVDRYLRGQ
jgi:hypothetical protein